MALGQKIKLTLEDEREILATYDGRDIRAWESKTGKSALGVPMSLSMLTYFGWSAAKRDGTLNGEFSRYEAFDAVCVAVGGAEDEDDAEEVEPADPSEPPSPDTPSRASAG